MTNIVDKSADNAKPHLICFYHNIKVKENFYNNCQNFSVLTERRCLDSYRQQKINQSDCEIRNNCDKNMINASNNQRLGIEFDDLDSRLSLLCQVGDDVTHSCKICRGCQIHIPRSIHSIALSHIISTPMCIRSVSFLCQTQLVSVHY